MIPEDFPRKRATAVVAGAQPKLAVRLVEGRYTDTWTEEELQARYLVCADLMDQLVPYCSRKRAARPDWSLATMLEKVHTAIGSKGWDITELETSWIIRKLHDRLVLEI